MRVPIIDGVQCPQCNGESHVIDSRDDVKGAKRRRRCCDDCGHRYTTYEIHADEFKRIRPSVNARELDTVIATLRAIKVQFGGSNGHR